MIDRVKMNLQVALISQHYGLENQIIQTSEEVGELLQAMSKYKRDPSEIHQNAIATEVADVYIMLKQIVQLVGLSDEKIHSLIETKLNRQLERIVDKEKENDIPAWR